MDPLTILAGLKTGLAAGKSVAGLSKQIGQFFDATDAAKKQLQKKGVSGKSVNATALDRFAKLRQAAEAEEELKKFICEQLGPSHWNTLLKIRREVLAEKKRGGGASPKGRYTETRTCYNCSGYSCFVNFYICGCHRISSLYGLVGREGLL